MFTPGLKIVGLTNVCFKSCASSWDIITTILVPKLLMRE